MEKKYRKKPEWKPHVNNSITLNDNLEFGKYDGKTPKEVIDKYGGGYFYWLKNNTNKDINEDIFKYINKNKTPFTYEIPKGTPNEGQSKLIDYITGTLHNNDIEIISGSAGSGKTWSMRMVPFPEHTFGIALSHKAKTILQESLGRNCITIAAALAKKKVRDYIKGFERFETSLDNIDSERYIHILDEASMASEEDVNNYKKKYPNSKLILMGDSRQLLPPKGKSYFNSRKPDILLTENMRQGEDSVLLKEFQCLFKAMDNLSNYIPKKSSKLIKEKDFLKQYTEDTKYICFFKKTKKEKNSFIRKQYYGFKEELVSGDKMILEDSIYTGDGILLLPNSYEFSVDNFKQESKRIDGVTIDYWEIDVPEKDITLRKVKESSSANLETILNSYAAEKNWRIFYSIKDYFHSVDFSYAITSYKSQGSTFPNVTVDYNDMKNVNWDTDTFYRSLYVAMSRTKDKITLTNF